MNIFLSYASQDRAAVEPVRFALASQGHDIFFDREALSAGDEYDNRIRAAIERCDLFVAFLSPDTVDRGSYTLTEIEIAARKWPHPQRRVLPVVVRPLEFATIPAYLKSVTLLQPAGNVAASVADAVHQLARMRQHTLLKRVAIAGLVVLAIAVSYYLVAREPTNATLDGAPMTLVAAGEIAMGDGEWSPQRTVYVDAFYIDDYKTTTARYAKFLAATPGFAPPHGWDTVDLQRDGELPVVGVSWQEAQAYCRWVGKRLPSEAEWERAARGTDARTYPWGEETPTPLHANFANAAQAAYPDGLHAVGRHPAGRSASGVFDQAGNAAEWVADWFTDSFARSESRNPRGPDSGTEKTLRGGGWQQPAERMSVTRRWHAEPDTRADDVGFRCARNAAI